MYAIHFNFIKITNSLMICDYFRINIFLMP